MSCSTVRKEFVLATRMPLETGLMLFFKVAFVNGVLFIISIGIFLWIMIDNALRAHPPPLPQKMPHHPPTPGNIPGPPPSLNHGCINVKSGGNRWAHWLPGVCLKPPVTIHGQNMTFGVFAATFFEFVLFGMAVYKAVVSSSAKIKLNGRRSLTAILLHENIIYFFT